jgi:microcystin-dependent protein
MLESLEERVVLDSTGVIGSNPPVPFNTAQPSLPLHYIIAEQGLFPSQGPGIATEPLIGEVQLFSGTIAPNGWAFCDGQLLPISQYAPLFSVIGNTYGGNGTSTFALPDLRGRDAVGEGNGSVGQPIGSETATLSPSQIPEQQARLPTGGATGIMGTPGVPAPLDYQQPGLGLNYIIAVSGYYPSQSGVNGTPMLGEVQLFAGTFAPTGWAFCNGQLLSIAQNTALFSVIGTTYGGNGTSNFALPDLRGRDIVGVSQALGFAPGQSPTQRRLPALPLM